MDSIYTDKLSRRGIKLRKGRDLNLLKSIKVQSVINTEVQKVHSITPVDTLFQLLLGGKSPNAIVVNEKQEYVGTVELQDVREVIHESEELAFVVLAADVADRTAPAVVGEDTLDYVMQLFGKAHRDELPVCASKEDRTVIGSVSRKAVIDSYNAKIFTEDMTDGLSNHVAMAKAGKMVEMIPGIHICEIEAPSRWVDRELSELDLRKDYNIQVLLIQRSQILDVESNFESSLVEEIQPTPDFVFEHGDRVLVMGSKEDVVNIKT